MEFVLKTENIDDCKYDPCLNNGKCVDRIGSYECVCEDGWTGQNCEKEVEMCSVATCKNDANCINLFQDYFCVCPKGTDGKQCEVNSLNKIVTFYNLNNTCLYVHT